MAAAWAGTALAAGYARPVDMKLLILATTGEETGLAALRSFLDYQGTPYEVAKLAAGDKLPRLHDGQKGFYQGVILTLGNLGYCNPECKSALDPDGWNQLDEYTRLYRVRTLSYYTYPEARYGLTAAGSVSPSGENPLVADFTPDAEPIFRDLRLPQPLPIAYAFTYLAGTVAGPGETTKALLRAGPSVLAALHTTADGRESIALTFDNNPTLMHSLVLQRGLLDWLTRGVHLGWQKVWLLPQVDDLFLPNYLFDARSEECATNTGPNVEPGAGIPCKVLRMGADDLEAVATWQRSWRARPQFGEFRLNLAYNGYGVKTDDDPLLAAARRLSGEFFWVSHTYTHRHLDCYAPTETGCRGANYEETLREVELNRAAGDRFGLPVDFVSMVTPQISGLHNEDFLRGAADAGIHFLVSDTSRAEFVPLLANTGLASTVPAVFLIPRRPTAIFYNAADGRPGTPGSEPDEYNFLYGPKGIFRKANGAPFYAVDQQYGDIIEREADLTVQYLLRGEMYPLMFHQANLSRYQDNRTLITDLLERVLTKFEALSRLPVLSVDQTQLGRLLNERLGYWNAGVTATVWPDDRVTISAKKGAVVPVTGICEERCETYGPFRMASVAVTQDAVRELRVPEVQ
jgi:hypothetical protein